MNFIDKRVVLVVGKGGVGRSTVAASIALQNARAGKRTLLYQTNATDRFGTYFGKPALGIRSSELAPNLWGVNTNPAAALEEYGMMILRFKSVYEMVFENRVSKAFIRAIPGLDDYAMLGKMWFHTTEEKRGKPVWDTIVFDMPASGHSYSMLRVPWVITETVPDGPLTRDALTLKGLLTDPRRTATVIVTLAEEMPVNEAIELEAKLEGLGIVPSHYVANQIYPQHFPAGTPVAKVLDTLVEAGSLPSPLAEVTTHSLLARDRRLLNERYLAELRRKTDRPIAELPILFTSAMTSQHIGMLADTLARS